MKGIGNKDLVIMKWILRTKSKNIFLILFSPIILSMCLNIIKPIDDLILLNNIANILIFVWAVFMCLWYYYVGVSLFRIMTLEIKMNVKLFNLSIIFILLNNIFEFVKIFPSVNVIISQLPESSIKIITYIYFIFAVYVFYFISKILVSIENNKEVKFSEYKKELLYTFILFIGIWFLQPRINKIFMNEVNIGR